MCKKPVKSFVEHVGKRPLTESKNHAETEDIKPILNMEHCERLVCED